MRHEASISYLMFQKCNNQFKPVPHTWQVLNLVKSIAVSVTNIHVYHKRPQPQKGGWYTAGYGILYSKFLPYSLTLLKCNEDAYI